MGHRTKSNVAWDVTHADDHGKILAIWIATPEPSLPLWQVVQAVLDAERVTVTRG